jgi:pilus assembly protein Flp/PilA
VFDLLSQIRNDDESGQGMVEYGLIVGLIAIIVIAVFVALGPQINSMFSDAVSDESINDAQGEVENAIDMNNS